MKNDKSQILILGGSGFIGINLTKTLFLHGHRVIVYDKAIAFDSFTEKEKRKITFIKGDIGDTEKLEGIFEKYQIGIIIHLVSSIVPGVSFDEVLDDIGYVLKPTSDLVALMVKYRIEKIIFFSSGGTVYGMNGEEGGNSENSLTKPINLYGWLKLTIENYILISSRYVGIKYLIIRPSNVYGIFQRLSGIQGVVAVVLGNIMSNKITEIWGDGSVVRDYLNVKDLCDGLTKLIDTDKWNEIYNIGSGHGVNINELLRLIEKTVQRNIPVQYMEKRSVDIQNNILDISKIRRVIDWEPRIGLEQGINEFWESLK